MLFNTFLRKEGDPSDPKDPKDPKDPELGDPDPNADPQGGDQQDSSKKGELSAEEKAELESLRQEKETADKRVSDAQAEFHAKNAELKLAQKQVHDLKNPPVKFDAEYSNDPVISKLNERIKEYETGEIKYDTMHLETQKSARIRELKREEKFTKQEERLAMLEGRSKESDDIGVLLGENPNINDLTPAGKAKAKLTSRGEKVSIETAHFYQKGKEYDENFKNEVEAEVKKRLEADKKGGGARGQEGGFEEPEPVEDKEKDDYVDFLHEPSGLDIK